jgi:hypothetical protein
MVRSKKEEDEWIHTLHILEVPHPDAQTDSELP